MCARVSSHLTFERKMNGFLHDVEAECTQRSDCSNGVSVVGDAVIYVWFMVAYIQLNAWGRGEIPSCVRKTEKGLLV